MEATCCAHPHRDETSAAPLLQPVLGSEHSQLTGGDGDGGGGDGDGDDGGGDGSDGDDGGEAYIFLFNITFLFFLICSHCRMVHGACLPQAPHKLKIPSAGIALSRCCRHHRCLPQAPRTLEISSAGIAMSRCRHHPCLPQASH